jgi:uncharacterized protein (TIGR03118 family)
MKTFSAFPHSSRPARRAGLAATLAIAASSLFSQSATAIGFKQTNLVTDDPSANPAQITDASLKNAWGISSSGTSPFWVSDNGSGVSTLYRVDPATNATTKVGLTVSIPGDGSVTGQVFNGNAAAFHGDAFVFVSEDGTISGWRGALGTAAETLQSGSSANVYKGSAEATIGTDSYVYAANFRAGTIDVIKGSAGAPNLAGNFTDPNIPAGYAPFNIKNINGELYVTYALQDGAKKDDVAGAGHGFVSVFDLQGNFISRVGSQGTLDSPWGLALAPSSFGAFAGDLLVGNFGDGTINAFDLATNSFVGQLRDSGGNILSIDGLWGLTIGNGAGAGSSQSLYFSAGPNNESNGLFGVLSAVPEPAPFGLLGLGAFLAARFSRRSASRRWA